MLACILDIRGIFSQFIMHNAAIRELYRAKVGDSSPEFSSSTRDLRLYEFPQNEMDEIKTEIHSPEEMRKIKEAFSEENEVEMPRASLIGLNDAADEFFDVPEPAELDHYENEWTADSALLQQHSSVLSHTCVFIPTFLDPISAWTCILSYRKSVFTQTRTCSAAVSFLL